MTDDTESLSRLPAQGNGSITLRPYQLEALNAIDDADRRGVRRMLAVLPTGTGKTIMFGELLRRRGGRALVLAHRDELIHQAVNNLRLINPSAQIGIVKAEQDGVDAPLVVASVQTLSRPTRLARLVPHFGTVVVDEAHHSTAQSYRAILDRVGAFADGGPLTIGVTATPERTDDGELRDVWEDIVYRTELVDMILAGYLADLRAIQVRLDANLDAVHTRAGDLAVNELDEALRAANAPAHTVTAYEQYAAGRKALVFTPSVQSAHDMACAFVAAGYPAESLDGRTVASERAKILDRFRSGETQVVCNCAVLTEGFDEPSIACVIIARPTKSRPLYAQMIGRGTRLSPGKTDCLVLDLVGSTSRHELVTAATLFNVNPTSIRDNSVAVAVARNRKVREQHEAEGRLVAQTVDLFRRRALNWVQADPTRYVLTIAGGLIVLRTSNLATWRVEHVSRDQSTVVAQGLDLGYAQGVGEDFARRRGAGTLVNPDAAWRRYPATDKQIGALQRWRIPYWAGITKGQASDLLAAAVGRTA